MPVALEHLAHAPSSVSLIDAAGLRLFPDAVPDPGDRRSRRHPLSALLAAVAAAVLAGARSLAAIGEWITDALRWAVRALGFAPDPLTGQVVVPHPATVRRLLARLDGDALDAAIGTFLSTRAAACTRAPDALWPIAVDGKTVRGSRIRTTAVISLPAAMTHSGEVLSRHQVTGESKGIPSFAPLLNGVDLARAVITADALHTQHGHGTCLRSRGAHYIAVVKKNHPGLFGRVRVLPWREITLDHYERTRAHHRDEIRRLKTVAFAHLDYPDARQALHVVRWRRDRGSGKLTIERVYLITSLPPGAATGAQLASWIRGRWDIENLLHHVRDRTFREDDSKARSAHLPRTMASLRNPAIGLRRKDGQKNIAAALRRAARDCRRPLTLLGLTG